MRGKSVYEEHNTPACYDCFQYVSSTDIGIVRHVFNTLIYISDFTIMLDGDTIIFLHDSSPSSC